MVAVLASLLVACGEGASAPVDAGGKDSGPGPNDGWTDSRVDGDSRGDAVGLDASATADSGCGTVDVPSEGASFADSGICNYDEVAHGPIPWEGVGTHLCGDLPGGGGTCGPCPAGQKCVAVLICNHGVPVGSDRFTGSCSP